MFMKLRMFIVNWLLNDLHMIPVDAMSQAACSESPQKELGKQMLGM